MVDYVGTLANAATVISRLHQGEKRLVFCDSRSRVEDLAQYLRAQGTETYVSHSSLSIDERRRAEAAFAEGTDCVIVATSTLELGIDVGDLDRVIQIDAPYSVAAFLQRLGRSGRRAGGRRNCLFLTTNSEALLRALGLLHLWRHGYVEPVSPPVLPYHVLAQQILAATLQESGLDRVRLEEWLGRWADIAGFSPGTLVGQIDHMLKAGILFEDGGVIGVGREGEARYGAKNFLEIFSVFNSPPLFTVYHGLVEVGQVDALTFRHRSDGPIHLSLGGRGWKVTYIDWSRRRAYVEVAEEPGRSRWQGTGQSLHFDLAQAIKSVLCNGSPARFLSRRAVAELEVLRDEFAWLDEGKTTLITTPDTDISRWWTFAGDGYNAAAAERLRDRGYMATFDGMAVSVAGGNVVELPEDLERAVADLARSPTVGIAEDAVEEIKFGEIVPAECLEEMLGRRLEPGAEVEAMAGRRVRARLVTYSQTS
jgi:ATP-dependent Lhr-like helicase